MDPVASLRRRLARVLRVLLLGLVGLAGAFVAALWAFQDRLLYPGAHFAPEDLAALPAGLTALHDPQQPESIVGYYRGPGAGQTPRRLWLMFSGNGDNALRWDPLIEASAASGDGFLMVEYPGYGARAGKPSPEALLAGTEGTLQALAQQLGQEPDELEPRTACRRSPSCTALATTSFRQAWARPWPRKRRAAASSSCPAPATTT